MTAPFSFLSKLLCCCAIWCAAGLFAGSEVDASLVGHINADQQIVLVGDGNEVFALDFASAAGELVPFVSQDDSPFELLIANSSNNVAVGTLGPAVVIDGQLNTGVGYTGEVPESDLVAVWANADDQITSLPVGFDLPVSESLLSGVINFENQLVLMGEGLSVIGLQLTSTEGQLVPLPPGDLTADASPFAIVLANDATGITLGNLGEGVAVDGELLTPITYLGSSPESDLLALWGAEGSSEQRTFTITKEVCGGPLPGDIDGNGEVGFLDFLILSDGFGKPGTFEQGDLDCNGTVDFPDFLILSEFFGTSASTPANVPEPNQVSWLAIVLGWCVVRAKKVGGSSSAVDRSTSN